ncbi:MAG: hypothetical protein KAT58_03840 [candidate division Zixibacteria bacterium]|nr:hypothetical protein [candidate division Zixibacteria bacterium]
MSYGKLVTDAINISGKNWWLWIFGFFVSLGDAGSAVGHLSKGFKPENISPDSLELLAALALGLIALALLAGVIYLILMIIAEASLIVAVREIKTQGRGGFAKSLSAGIRFFWRLLGIWFLVLVVSLAVSLLCAIPVVLAFIIHVALGIMALLAVGLIWLILIVAIIIIEAYAFRFAVIEDKPVFDAIDAGRKMLKENIWASIAVGLISFFSQLVIGLLMLLLAVVIGIPFILAGTVNLWLGLVPGLIVAFIFLVVIYGFLGTYASSLWTLAYLQLKELAAPQQAEVVVA